MTKIAIIDEGNAMMDILNIDTKAMDASVKQWCEENGEEFVEDDIETYLNDVLGYRLNHMTWMEVNASYEFNCIGSNRVPVHSWEKQGDIVEQALKEIREMLGSTPDGQWHFGHDYCGEDGGGDVPFVNAHHVMQDDRICEIGIDALGLEDDGGITMLYHIASDDEIGEEQFGDSFTSTVLSQDYQEVAYALHEAMGE